jgi:hypothetical protein
MMLFHSHNICRNAEKAQGRSPMPPVSLSCGFARDSILVINLRQTFEATGLRRTKGHTIWKSDLFAT